jgi:hypothetical protein
MRQDRLNFQKGSKFELVMKESDAPVKELSPVPIEEPKQRARWGENEPKAVEEFKDELSDEDREDDFSSVDSDDDLTKASVQELPSTAEEEARKEVEEVKEPNPDYIGIYSDSDNEDTEQFVGDQAYAMYKELL